MNDIRNRQQPNQTAIVTYPNKNGKVILDTDLSTINGKPINTGNDIVIEALPDRAIKYMALGINVI